MLADGQEVSPETFRQLQAQLEEAGHHPLGGDGTSEYLRRVVQQVSPRGRMVGRGELIPLSGDLVISRDPALFLRVRMSGFPAAFERVLEALEGDGELPASLTRLVGVLPRRPPTPRPSRFHHGESRPMCSSVSRRTRSRWQSPALDRHQAVLVQGPPGTGKSRAIANLVGHLVAQGQKVLITSHATKALRVLRSQLSDTLQPLCMHVLENDLETRGQMEQSVRGILSRLTASDAMRLEREVEEFTTLRQDLNEKISHITSDLQWAAKDYAFPS